LVSLLFQSHQWAANVKSNWASLILSLAVYKLVGEYFMLWRELVLYERSWGNDDEIYQVMVLSSVRIENKSVN
jgi:hypothetical protein